MKEFGLFITALLLNFAIRFIGAALHDYPIIMQAMLLLSILVPGSLLYFHLRTAADTNSSTSEA